jgi:hypothetical protein
MEFKIFDWLRKNKSEAVLRAERIAYLEGQVELAREFQRIVESSRKLRVPLKLIVSVDPYKMAVLFRPGDDLVSYLIDFSAGSRIGWQGELARLHGETEEGGEMRVFEE